MCGRGFAENNPAGDCLGLSRAFRRLSSAALREELPESPHLIQDRKKENQMKDRVKHGGVIIRPLNIFRAEEKSVVAIKSCKFLLHVEPHCSVTLVEVVGNNDLDLLDDGVKVVTGENLGNDCGSHVYLPLGGTRHEPFKKKGSKLWCTIERGGEQSLFYQIVITLRNDGNGAHGT